MALVALNVIPSIVGLLGHDNIDIAVDVVGLLMDLTNKDILEDNDELAKVLVDALVENNVLDLLVQNMGRLSEVDLDEAAAIYYTLATIENMIEVKLATIAILRRRKREEKSHKSQDKNIYKEHVRTLPYSYVENECEKIDRLMELYMRYSNRVKTETERLDRLELDDLEIDEEERYNKKLEAGLYTLQLIAVILGHLWSSDHQGMRGRIELLLRQQKLRKKDVKEILQEYHDNIGDVDGPEEKERCQGKIQKFINFRNGGLNRRN